MNAETIAEKNRRGIVIQHRSWKLSDVFRSEDDSNTSTRSSNCPTIGLDTDLAHSLDGRLLIVHVDTPLKPSNNTARSHILPALSTPLPPSSPPAVAMPYISSPVAYPATSSPSGESPRKRRKVEAPRSLLQNAPSRHNAKSVGGFLVENSDEEDDLLAMKALQMKRSAAVDAKATVKIKGTEVSELDRTGSAHDDCGSAQMSTEEPLQEEFELERTPPLSAPQQPQGSLATDDRPLMAKTASGRTFYLSERRIAPAVSYEQLIASRSTTAPGRAQKSYYGIDIHQLMDDAARETEATAQLNREQQAEAPQPSVEQSIPANSKSGKTLMWTEKYRARKFTDLIGDERTHRSVLRWLKAWDPIVFPGSGKPKPKAQRHSADGSEERTHRKILLLTGPPGLGKTTLAHVCAKQAGYEVQEINASDERSKDVVKGRIRDMVGTENVRGTETKTTSGKVRKAGRPVCVVVDEVDGVVSGSGGSGDGGFIKALVDLVSLDQKNSRGVGEQNGATTGGKRRKGDRFRLLRPMILICNDVYHPSLRPLRQSSIAEIIHVRKPALNMVVLRMKSVFEKERVPCDSDGVRRLCEAAWGVSSRKEGGSGTGTGEGDIRGVMVVGEWVASKLRSTVGSNGPSNVRLTRGWVEDHVINDLSHNGGAARSLGRGGAREVVDRVFREGAGFPKIRSPNEPKASGIGGTGAVGVAEASKRLAMDRLREMVDTSGESDRIITGTCILPFHPQASPLSSSLPSADR